MRLARKRLDFIVALLFCFFILTIYIARTSTSPAWPTQKQHPNTASRYQASLAHLSLSETFEFRRQCLKARQRRGLERRHASLFNATGDFMVQPVQLRTAELLDPEVDTRLVTPGCSKPLTIDVPAPAHLQKAHAHEFDGSTLMLGMATSLKRLQLSLPEMARWLADSSTPLLVILRDQISISTDGAVAAMELAHTLHIKLILIPRNQFAIETKAVKEDAEKAGGEAQSNFGLARAFLHYKAAATKWFGVIDDDTFFVSLPSMIRALEPYSPEQPYYIGALSERHLGMNTEGFKAWGGAGIFMTLPLIAVLAASFDTCINMAGTWGDALWRDCIALSTSPTVQLTQLPGLHQLDMLPSLAGWYESGPWPMLTLHHWKSWHSFPLPEAHLVTSLAGPRSLFARFAFRTGGQDLVFTNGYSLVEYPSGLPDFNLAENTFVAYPESTSDDDGVREYRFSLGRLRPRMQEGKDKRSWILEHAVNDGGTIRQFYVRRGAGPDGTDSVFEVDWVR